MEHDIMYSLELLLRLKEDAEHDRGKEQELYSFFEKIRNIAIKGNTVAQQTLSECYAYNICNDKISIDKYTQDFLKIPTQEGTVGRALEYLFGFNNEAESKELGIQIIRQNDSDPKAQFILGMCYLKGIGVNADFELAFKWFKESAENGLPEAQNWVGNCLWDGIGTQTDKKESFLWIEKSAQQNDNQALLNLGYCYDHGIDGFLETDKEKALEIYKLAAWFGNPLASDNINIIEDELDKCKKIYDKGMDFNEACPPKQKQAKDCFEQCAKMNYKPALLQLGILSYERRDYQEASRYFMRCGDNDDAYYYLGMLCEKGLVCDKDLDKAAKYYSESDNKFAQDALKRLNNTPEQSYRNAFAYFENKEYEQCIETIKKYPDYSFNQNLIGICYLHGHGVIKDSSKAVSYFQKSADQGNPKGIFHLGMCFLMGDGVNKDEGKARELINKASEMDHLPAKLQLGIFLIQGKFLKKDELKGLSLIKHCMDQGYIPAYNILADCYKEGIGVEKNIEKAKEYYKLYLNKYSDISTEYEYSNIGGKVFSKIDLSEYDFNQIKFYSRIGVPIARTYLAMCYLSGYKTNKDYSKAVQILEENAQEDEPSAQVILGICYDSGIGVEEDKIKALELFTKSANNNNYQGMYNLAVYYWNGSCEDIKDKDKAIELLKKSSEHYSASKTMLDKINGGEKNLKMECTKLEELIGI